MNDKYISSNVEWVQSLIKELGFTKSKGKHSEVFWVKSTVEVSEDILRNNNLSYADEYKQTKIASFSEALQVM